jgi:hypothetical protein
MPHPQILDKSIFAGQTHKLTPQVNFTFKIFIVLMPEANVLEHFTAVI